MRRYSFSSASPSREAKRFHEMSCFAGRTGVLLNGLSFSCSSAILRNSRKLSCST